MSKKYKFGQILGIFIGVVGGSMLVRAIIGPRQPQYVQQQYSQPQQIQYQQQQQGVFEQAVSGNSR